MEFVFVVPRSELFRDCYPQGLLPFGPAGSENSWEAFEAAMLEHGHFVEREHAERNPALQQIIPYTLVLARGRSLSQEDGGTTDEGILLMRRLAQGGEARLHDKLSIGVGGHINPEDLVESRGRDLLARGARRELEEELVIEGTYRIDSVGFLNDDSNAVGAVHVGLVQVLHLDGSVKIREEDVLEGKLVSADELKALAETGANFETWSSLLVERLDELLPATETLTH